MNLKRTIVALSLVFGASFAYAANQSTSLNGFDFNYSVDLNKSVGLTQVFDDGDRTYFQFTQADSLPTIFAIKNGKKITIPLEVRPPYLIAAGVANKYMLSINAKTSIYVSYNGNRAEDSSQPQQVASIAPSQDTSTKIDTPVKQANVTKKKETTAGAIKDKPQTLVTGTLFNVPFFENSVELSKKARADLAARLDEINSAGKVVVRGRPSVKGDSGIANTRALAIQNYLVEIGVDESTIETTSEQSVKAGKNQGFYVSELVLLAADSKASGSIGADTKKTATAKKINTTLNIKAGDSISEQLALWSKPQGYTVIWEAQEYRASAPLVLDKGLSDTIDSVVGSMKMDGIYLDVTIYENHVIRITETK